MSKSHHIQSDTWFYSGFYIWEKWKFNYTFLHCCNPLFISSELLTLFCHAETSAKVVSVQFNCPRASKSDVLFFILMTWVLLIESDYSTSHATGGAGKVRPVCVVLGNGRIFKLLRNQCKLKSWKVWLFSGSEHTVITLLEGGREMSFMSS